MDVSYKHCPPCGGGKPLPFHEAVVGGRSVGTPGTLKMLELAHRQHGRSHAARPALSDG